MTVLLPIGLRVEGRQCVVVGGGSVALRRVRSLLECGASVIVVAPVFSSELASLAAEKGIVILERAYGKEVLRDALLVVAATDDPQVNEAVRSDARAAGVLCCDAGESEAGDFVSMAAIRRGDLLIGVTTGGASPSSTIRIQSVLGEQFGPEWADYLAILREARDHATESVPNRMKRRRILGDIAADESLFVLVLEGRADEARARIEACILSP